MGGSILWGAKSFTVFTELLIREGIEDYLKIIFLISQQKHMFRPHIRTISVRFLHISPEKNIHVFCDLPLEPSQ